MAPRSRSGAKSGLGSEPIQDAEIIVPGAAARGAGPSNHACLINWVVVLGDFGRSPRMQYHAASLASKPNSVVHVVAYGGAAPMESLTSAPNVHITYLPEVPRAIMRLPGLLRLVAKVLHQLVAMAWIMLVSLPSPSNILMQNPPAIPTMVLCWLAARRHGASLVIDWHNFGYSIMALKHAPTSLLVRTARAHELAWGACADKAFCVTGAMRAELASLSRARIDAAVLYDRPPDHFRRTAAPVAHALLARLAPSIAAQDGGRACDDWAAREASSWGPARTALTLTTAAASGSAPVGQAGAGAAAWRADRPAVLVSSTSWTPDEDFGILLDALVMYEQAAAAAACAAASGDGGRRATRATPSKPPPEAPSAQQQQALPRLLVLITGRGPQRAEYLARIAALSMAYVSVRSLWLEAADYPTLLGVADLGVSLHASSSGLDLPMKVVDMFGSGLPVCALSYACIGELVEDGQTGLLFDSPRQLCDQLARLLRSFPAAPSEELSHMRERVASTQGLRWQENWDDVAWPMLQSR